MTNYDILKEYEAHQTPVPSYDEWKEYQELEEDYKKNVQLAIRFSIEAEILKELLKECRHIIGIEKDFASCHFEEYTLVELLTKIDEALQ